MDCKYRIYIDIKDTQGGKKVKNLHKVLCNSIYDFDKKIVENIQIIRSNESDILQLADILIGAISYFQRSFNTSQAKNEILKKIQERSHYPLTKSTLFQEDKFNIFLWRPSEQ